MKKSTIRPAESAECGLYKCIVHYFGLVWNDQMGL
jgi:hypothetical protein